MKVYVLISESEAGGCCSVYVDEFAGVFATVEAAQRAGPTPTKKRGWRQNEDGGWYFGRTDTKSHHWEQSHRIEEHEVQELTRDVLNMQEVPCGCGRDVVIGLSCSICDNDE